MKRGFPIFSTALVLCAVCVLLGLGVWQVQRAAWKQGILASYEARRAEPILTTLPDSKDGSEIAYRSAEISGTYLNSASVKIRPRVQGTQMGFDRVTPFRESTGKIILVLTGFEADATDDKATKADMPGSIKGILRPFHPHGFMQPENNPAKDEWVWVDAAAIAKQAGLPEPYPLLLVKNATSFLVELPNNHMAYAFTWFSLALALAVIYGVAVRKTFQHKKD